MRGLVLAGGLSARYGRDKATAPWRAGHDETFAERARRALAERLDDVWISCRRDQPLASSAFGDRLIYDADAAGRPSQGPGAGLRAAHLLHPNDSWLALACDLPNVDQNCLDCLLAALTEADAALTFAQNDGVVQPLLGIWTPRALQEFLFEPMPSPRLALKKAGARALPCPDERWLVNVNRPN